MLAGYERAKAEALAYLEATAKAKYRGLSTAAAKAPPSVEMTCVGGGRDGVRL
jgi:hypothetical protein